MKEALFWEPLEDNKVRCKLCPWNCVLSPGQVGVCRARKNIDGKLYSLNYGKLTGIAIDPIEKKPLFHFWPNSYVLSFGSFGCNFVCPWCQNWEISKARMTERGTLVANGFEYFVEIYTPEEIVNIPGDYQGIAYTYNEPTVFIEFALDVMELARKKNLYNVWVTNGYINREPLEEVVKYLDAANIDVKIFNEERHRRFVGGKLENVLNTILFLKEKKIWIELTHLVIPTVNNKEEEFRRLVDWIYENLGPDTPLHITRYYPAYKFKEPPTPISLLEKFRDIAMEKLNFVYVGNVGYGEDTYCPVCGELLIRRRGMRVVEWNLTKDNRCPKCGAKIPIVGEHVEEKGSRVFFI